MNSSTKYNTKELIDKSTKHVQGLMENQLPEYIEFHNWDHTKSVIKEVKKIAKKEDCTDSEIELLELAAIFHDVGYIQSYDNHEAASIETAKDYLQSKYYPQDRIEIITQLIDVTQIDKQPTNKLEQIIVDADLAHLGQKKYTKKTQALLNEKNTTDTKPKNLLEWNNENIEFFKNHEFLTEAAKDFYAKRKRKNYLKLKNRRKSLKKAQSISENKAARMIFKTSLRNHIDLTSIADKKANIMLSINALILSLGMPLFVRYLMEQPELAIPAVIFLFTCAITMILATLATRPVKTSGKTNLSKLSSGRSNLFFFGNFHKLKLNEYHSGIEKILGDQEILDKSIVNDLYYLGNSLGYKFSILRICYTFFAGGIFTSFLVFITCYFYYAQA